jgi:glycerol-3-phosphate dehydrogenase
MLLRAGLITYDLMSGRLGIRRHRRISKRTAARLLPCLKTNRLQDAFIYYDAQTDDSRLTVTVIRTAAMQGALVANHVELTGFIEEQGKIVGALAKDHISGETLTIKAGTVVNAGGVFAGRIEEMARLQQNEEAKPDTGRIRIKPAKGVHLTVPRSALKLGRHAVVLPETDDGRLLFLVPWGSRVTIGTTDTEGGDIERPVAGADDVVYLLRHVNRYMRCELQESDIISTWAGYRPLVSSSEGAKASSRLSRTHAVLDGPGGLVTVVGGKLTTYRRMAQDTLDHIGKRQGTRTSQVTERLPLSGSEGWQSAQSDVISTASEWGLGADTVARLSSYGANSRLILDILRQEPLLAERIVSDLPYIMAEVVYACRYEMAMELADVLERRLRIGIEDWSHGVDAAPRVAALMAAELGWGEAEIKCRLERYRTLIAEQYPHPGALEPRHIPI